MADDPHPMTVEPVTADGAGPVGTVPGLLRHDRDPTSVRRKTTPARAFPVGALLRQWRTRRGLSQLALALEAAVSARHVSFFKTGRSRPRAQRIVRLAGQLQIPLRDRALSLAAAGHAPEYGPGDPDCRHIGPVGKPPAAVDPCRGELAASQARLVAAADEARRRLERDLHDGAQQRFVLATVSLKRAAARARGTPAAPLLDEAYQHLQQGLAELRDLAHGIYPAVLSDHGLAPALAGLAARSTLPVDVRVTRQRVPPTVETAIYFTVAEALTNIAKHAHATSASVTIDIANGVIAAEIADDGIGGATITAGSGLRGLADRLDALGGTLSIDSPRGGPTSIRAQAPLPPHP